MTGGIMRQNKVMEQNCFKTSGLDLKHFQAKRRPVRVEKMRKIRALGEMRLELFRQIGVFP